jgi:hypothetical protein
MLDSSSIPWTYTLAERPTTFRKEAKLWLQAVGRVKHQFIWFENTGIKKEDFAKIKSNKNIENYNRFSFISI